MLAGKVSALILATAFAAGAAGAQVPRGFTPQGADQQRLENNTSLSSKLYQDGVDAIRAKNFNVAEGIFEEVLRQNPTHPEGNLMMGTTKMSLGKWEEAKKYLEIAVRKSPKNPDPKSRLAVTLIKLGDMEGAMKQRADLEKMDKDCKGKCRNAEWIAGGLAMIDGAMPPKP
jgi:predicted Zn-dependent protease